MLMLNLGDMKDGLKGEVCRYCFSVVQDFE